LIAQSVGAVELNGHREEKERTVRVS
jgi:hypothetical protein